MPHIVSTAVIRRHLQVVVVRIIIHHLHRHQDLEPQAARTAVEPGAQVIHLLRQELALLQEVVVQVQELKPHQQ
jgi:hypothetical protein